MLPPPSILLVPGWLTPPKSGRRWPAKVPGTNGDKLAGRVFEQSPLKRNLLPGTLRLVLGAS